MMDGSLVEHFNSESVAKPHKKKPHTVPLSIRVTEDEKARIKQMAGDMAVGHFVRQRVLDGEDEVRPKRHCKKQRQPKIDHVELARVLGMFGQSELAQGILALSLAVQAGELEVTTDVSEKITSACNEIHEIKHVLITALGITPQESHG